MCSGARVGTCDARGALVMSDLIRLKSPAGPCNMGAGAILFDGDVQGPILEIVK